MKYMKYISLISIALLLLVIGCETVGLNRNTSGGKMIPEEQSSSKGIEFTYSDPTAKSVSLVGEFNNWDANANPMKNENGKWKTNLDLAQGSYQYKFLVNGTDWKQDPNNPQTADDGYGGKNSLLKIGGRVASAAVKEQKNTIEATSTKVDADGVTFTYNAPGAQSVHLVGEFNNWNTTANPMKNTNGNWKITIPLAEGKYQYKFLVNGTDWKNDPNNTKTADDGYGGNNSVIEVGKQIAAGKTEKTEKPADTQKKEQAKEKSASTDTKEVTTTPASSDTYPVKFEYKPLTGGSHTVFLAGDFNSWSTTATPMIEKNGNYEVTLNLKKGKYGYKFIVDGNWITDDNAKDTADDGYGGQNSLVFAGAPADVAMLREVTFSYQPKGTVQKVYLVGSFNNWNQNANPMYKWENNTYKTTLLLKPDSYTYKFLVNGTDWIPDPNAKNSADDGFGGKNSVLEVDDSYTKVTIAPGDGQVLPYGISTQQSLENINPLSESQIEFKTKAHMNDVESVSVKINGQVYPMKMVGDDGSFTYYRYVYHLQKKDEPLTYRYIYKDGKSVYSLWDGGFTDDAITNKPTSSTMPIDFRYPSNAIQPFYTPDWVKNGVIYQIFPERFANGDKTNDPQFKEWYYEGINVAPKPGALLPSFQPYYHMVNDWYDISGLTKSPYHQGNQPDYNSFYGGDIAGVDQNLNYLKDLGITIIYFNPVTQGKSNHKYDATDYLTLDSHFGTEAEFKSLVKHAHDLGIRIIIDVAYNHTGETHWAFQDGMKKGPSSEYYKWYEWRKWPMPSPLPAGDKPSNYYDCWWGFGEMPNLNYDLKHANSEENGFKDMTNVEANTPVVNYVLSAADYWIGKLDIDGFRLDVPNEVPFWFWEKFRERVKSLKSDAYLVGEIWTNASDWVNNKYFDSVMNYAYFRDPVQRFIIDRKTSAKKFDQELKPGVMNYPVQASEVMMNLIDSHDTYRFLESAKGDVSKLKLAALFQMTWMGAPHIWYGDEIGMMGAKDPDCRRPFNWKYTQNRDNVALHDYYRKLISIRQSYSALRTGTITPLVTDGMVYGYLRNLDEENVIVIINNEQTDKSVSLSVNLPNGVLKDVLNLKDYTLSNNKLNLSIPAMTGVILVPVASASNKQKVIPQSKVTPSQQPKKEAALQGDKKVTPLKVKEIQVAHSIDNAEMSENIYFSSGSAVLDAKARITLDKLISGLKGDHKVELVGYSDTQPIKGALAKKYPTNWDLSVARSVAVANYLIKNGKIDYTKITFSGKGESDLISDKDAKNPMKSNRRVEILIK